MCARIIDKHGIVQTANLQTLFALKNFAHSVILRILRNICNFNISPHFRAALFQQSKDVYAFQQVGFYQIV
jgi:hypothetical protein